MHGIDLSPDMVAELRAKPGSDDIGVTVRPFTVTPTHLGFDEYDVASQGLTSHHYWVADGRRERWSDWNRAPFTDDSTMHVSVWEKTPSPRSSRASVRMGRDGPTREAM